MDYKNTLNLPQTDFSMKANLSAKEPQILSRWETQGLYQQIRGSSKGRPLFILHDGPPYANGHIHIGHALNKILKDIIVKYKSLRGFDAPYIPGWDCHGLPVEHQLFKDLNKTKDQVDRVEFRNLAHGFAMKFVDIQRQEFRRLGVIGDWDYPYLTLDRDYEHAILTSFARLVEKGYVYRGLKPVNWCFKCETALAEAEVEYLDHESDSVFVRFELSQDDEARKLRLGDDRGVFILIWTTTPWTLLANVAVAVHPGLDYAAVTTEGGTLIVAEGLFKSSLREKLGIKDHRILFRLKGKQLEGLVYQHPLGLRKGKVVLADYVSKEEGTGCVHTAPGHGQEDFMTGLKYGLEVVMPVDENGRFDQGSGEFSGQHVFEANEKILQRLAGAGRLVFHEKYTHTYPHCWRCKNPVIFRATQQWFLKIGHRSLRKALLRAIQKNIAWIPSSGRERISSMVENRPDWCLSRQRYWGVPIPAVICAACQRHILDSAVIDNLARRVREEGSDAWFKRAVEEFLPADFRCACTGREFRRSTDILDVWFDSGASHQAVLKGRPGLKIPADLYLEGSDQHRGWFQSSLIPAMAIDGKPPFEAVLTHGFVVDGEGRKMSKSLGNVISPQEIIKDYGADILRLWVLASDYNEDVRISKEILNIVADAYRKIRNTARFLLGNLYDFDPDRDRLSLKEMLEIDRWALFMLSALTRDVTQGYEAYKFYHVFQKIYSYCNEDLSSLYLDILKDRLYTAAKKSKLRRSAQTAIYEILKTLAGILSPVLCFTCEEIYARMPKESSASFASVHLSAWPQILDDYRVKEKDVTDMRRILAMRPPILKALETKRASGEIGSSLEAKVILTLKERILFDIFSRHEAQLPFIFIVSQIELHRDEKLTSAFRIAVVAAEGRKCARCWNYSLDVDNEGRYPGICGRCAQAVAAQ